MSNTAHLSCTQNCRQGRDCTCAPSPAEACTEVGADDTRPTMTGADAVLLMVMVILSACFSAWALCTFAAHIKTVLGLP